MRAIVPSSFMISQITAAGWRPGEAREIDRALGLAGAAQHAAGLGDQREHVARARQVATAARSRAIATWIVRARSAAEMPVVTPSRASIETVNAVPNGVSFSAVAHHHRQVELARALGREREADQAAPVHGHEVHGLGRALLGGHAQVALVLAVLVVDEDDHLAGADLRERARTRCHHVVEFTGRGQRFGTPRRGSSSRPRAVAT